jgi:deoxyribonuclease V
MAHSSLEDLPDMWRETYDLVAQVPSGMVTTYGEVAKALGDPIAARFVGLAMSVNSDTGRVPCRRVVRSDGGIGGYSSPAGMREKVALLKGEGIAVRNWRIQDLERHLFVDFRSSNPLESLRRRQDSMRSRVKIPTSDIGFSTVTGVDVSYAGDKAHACAVVLDARTKAIKERLHTTTEARFPYIPTYLAFRELPIVSGLMDMLDDGTTLMLDGHGILHPKRFGIASHAGVAFGLPTIGVAKSLLYGSVRGPARKGARAVEVDGMPLGWSYSNCGRRPIFVSPGHCISLRQALTTVRKFTVHRIPEPTRVAHLLANAERRLATNK